MTFMLSASRAPSFTLPSNCEAADAHSGSRFLQWPHQGAKNSTSQISSLSMTVFSKLLSVSWTTLPFPPLPPLDWKQYNKHSNFRYFLNSFLLENKVKHTLWPLPPLPPPPPSRWLTIALNPSKPPLTRPSAVRGPLYASGWFLLAPKILMVGNPRTPNLPASSLWESQSIPPTLTIPYREQEVHTANRNLISGPNNVNDKALKFPTLRAVAAFLYSGARLLQCPHLGRNQTKHVRQLTGANTGISLGITRTCSDPSFPRKIKYIVTHFVSSGEFWGCTDDDSALILFQTERNTISWRKIYRKPLWRCGQRQSSAPLLDPKHLVIVVVRIPSPGSPKS